MNRLENKIDKIADIVTEIQVIQAKQEVNLANNTESLVQHMRRTELLENRIEPIEGYVHNFKGILKFIGFVGLIVSIVAGIFKIIA